jgi:uncharacterized membrane protein YraQ (UPF0718 family)
MLAEQRNKLARLGLNAASGVLFMIGAPLLPVAIVAFASSLVYSDTLPRVGCALLLAATVAVLGSSVILQARAERLRRAFFALPRCSRCGYDLRATTSPRCPECGASCEAAA